MTKLTMTFEEKDYGADVSVDFEGNVKDIISAFGSLQYELMHKLVDKKKISDAEVVNKVASACMTVAADYLLDKKVDLGEVIMSYSDGMATGNMFVLKEIEH